MADYEDKLSVALPEELRLQFVEVERRLWRVETTVAICSVAGGLMVSFLGLFISDRFWDTPSWLRWTLWFAGLILALVSAGIWARRWVWQRRDLRSLANLVQKKYRRLGDRLLGIVELSNEKEHNANFSPALYHAAIFQVAEEAKGFDFAQSVNAGSAKRTAGFAIIAAVCLAAIFLVLPRPGWNAFARWAAPMASIPRYTLVTIDGLPGELIVPHGEAFSIAAKVQYRSFWKPSHAFGLWPRQPSVETTVRDGTAQLQIPGKVENGVLEVRVGDAKAQIRIAPTHRPSLQELAAQIQLPDYLHYPSQNELLQNGTLLAVEGSKVSLRGKISRDLNSATIQRGDGKPAPLAVSGDSFSTTQTEPEGAADFTILWKDKLGLTNASPLRVTMQTQPDAPPVPEIDDIPTDVAVLDSDVLNIKVKARDDFGVRDVGLNWEMTADSPVTGSPVATTEVKFQMSTPQMKEAERTFKWSPRIYRIPADSTVELTAFARYFFPNRERARTAVYHIRVLSPEEHAEMLRKQLEATMAQVEEVSRLQEKIVANLEEIKEAEKMPAAEKATRLSQSKEDQKQNAANLDQLAKQGEETLQEALKNPLFKEDAVKKWSQSMQQLQKLAQQKMPAAASAMQKAQESSGGKPEEMAEAEEKAEDVLKDLEKMQNKANEHMDDLQAMTLAQRLRKVGGAEKDIAGQIFDTASNTVGLLPRQLSPKMKALEGGLVRGQSSAQKQSTTLQTELNRFFERTQKPAYGQVSKEMKDAHTGDELDRVGGLINNNIGLEASADLGKWSTRFQDWAEKLEPKSSGSGSGSGQGTDLTEQLIALLRMRENESNLRDETTLLDQDRGTPDSYQQRASSLSGTQDKLASDLEGIHDKVPISQLDQAFSDVSSAMKQTSTLLQTPETGKPADDAEIKTIDSLSDLINLINEQGQKGKPKSSPGSSSSAEEMQFLMQMAQKANKGKAFAAKPNRGNTSPCGSSSRVGGANMGDASVRAADERSVKQAAGAIPNAPAEFRDALENYYHGLEKGKQ